MKPCVTMGKGMGKGLKNGKIRVVTCWVLSNSFIVIMVLYVVCLSHLFVDIHVPVHVVFVKSPVVLSVNTLSGKCVSLSTCIVIRSIVCKLVLVLCSVY